MSEEMSEEMSERATDIAEFTIMNDDSMQAIFMTQMRDFSEKMTDEWRIGCPIRWRIKKRSRLNADSLSLYIPAYGTATYFLESMTE